MKEFVLLFSSLLTFTLSQQYCQGSSCLPCYYQCSACSGTQPDQCLTCHPQYLLVNNYCSICTKNCKSCISTLGSSSWCQGCQSGFYLSQSTGLCYSCPTGAQLCTLSAIQQCKQGYYEQNGQCYSCIDNCLNCDSLSQCSQCQEGYYLSTEGECLACGTHCATCSETSCSQCVSGYEGTNCSEVCGQNCAICHAGTCYVCEQNYFLEADECLPLSILCKMGDNLSNCYECLSNAYKNNDGKCIPYATVNQLNRQVYITSFNNDENLISNYSTQSCRSSTISFNTNGTFHIQLQIYPVYALSLTFSLAAPSAADVWLESNSFEKTSNVSIENGIACDRVQVLNNKWEVSIDQNFNASEDSLDIFLVASDGGVGFLQLLLELYECSIQNCEICRSKYSCSSCVYPYLLENNNCVENCESGYYYTPSIRLCSLQCFDTYYPIFQDFTCLPCQSPCEKCTDSSTCDTCVDGFYLYQNQCLVSCPEGYFNNSEYNQCDSCLFPCKTCSSHSYCQSCQSGYLNPLNHTCDVICPSGYYINFTLLSCSICQSPCSTCLQAPTQCQSCENGYSLVEKLYTCVLQCPQSTTSVLSVCEQCQWPCTECNSTVQFCLQCGAGYLYNGTCILDCPSTFYPNNTQCVQCVYPCKECLDEERCLSCSNISHYFYSEKCLVQCPQKTYPTSQKICQTCSSPCQSCVNQSYCLSCSGYFMFYEGLCYTDCPDGTYLDSNSDLRQCVSCIDGCLLCMSNTSCQKCTNNLTLFDEECVEFCPDGTYSYGGNCLSCKYPCETCRSYGICLSCSDTYKFYNYKCVDQCPHSHYQNNSICQKCQQQCQSCIQFSDNCIQCASGYYFTQTGKCSSSCFEGYYPQLSTKSCTTCEQPCLTCLSSMHCLSCDKNSSFPYLFLHKCLDECPFGMTGNSQFLCVSCDEQCLECQHETDSCKECPHSSYLHEAKCLKECPFGWVEDESGICLECLDPCESCVDGSSYCQSCLSGLYSWNGMCLENCPKGYYGNNGTCIQCEYPCLDCSSKQNCLSCYTSYYIQSSGNNSICVSSCPIQLYPNFMSLSCVDCISPCLDCIDKIRCKSCQQNLILVDDSCVSWCPNNYYPYNGTCQKCKYPCATCISQVQCISCQSPLYFLESNSSCIEQCPSTHYGLISSANIYQCFSCPQYCLTCYDHTACKTCNPNSYRPYLQDYSCVAQCSSEYYLQNYVCSSCSENCIKCTNNTNCLQCINSYLWEGSCLDACPLYTYNDELYECQQCEDPCLQCYDQSNCMNCVSGYYLYKTFCLQHCPLDTWTYPSRGTCQADCEYFTHTPTKYCLLSCSLYYDEEGECKESCDEDTVVNKTLGCEKCSECPSVPYYRIEFVNNNNKFYIVLVFSKSMENWESFLPTDSFYQVQSETFREEEIQVHKLISSSTTLSVTKSSSKVIWVQIQPQKLGTIKHTISNLHRLTSNDYPLQNRQAQTSLSVNQASSSSFDWTYSIGLGLSIFLWLLVCMNLFLDNCRSMFLSIQIFQSFSMLLYLSVWFHPSLQNFFRGLFVTNFQLQTIAIGEKEVWQCDSKRIVYGEGCNLLQNCITTLFGFGAFILIVGIGKLIICRFRPDKHEICWNHLNNCYWIFGFVLSFSALGLINSSAQIIYLNIIILIMTGFLSILLWYQAVKNIFSGTYEDSTFFWALKKSHTVNPFSNTHYIMMMCRRVFFTVTIGLFPSKPLSALSITMFCSIFILANSIWNQPFKIYKRLIPTVQSLFTFILFLLQIYVVNLKEMTNGVWQVFSWFILAFILLMFLIMLWMGFIETIKAIKITRKKFLARNQVANEDDDAKTSSISGGASEKDLMNMEKKEEKNEEIKEKTVTSVKNEQEEEDWEENSDSIFSEQKGRSGFMPPKYLIKVSKKVENDENNE